LVLTVFIFVSPFPVTDDTYVLAGRNIEEIAGDNPNAVIAAADV